MATTVASRFSVLCDDAEDVFQHRNKRNAAKKHENGKPATTATAASSASKTASKNKKKKNKENVQAQVAKPKPIKTDPNKEASPEQWEEWQEKDKEMVDGVYKDDLTQAILLSKLDYEEKKDFYDQIKTEEPPAPEPVDKKSGRKGKKAIKILSVEEFHNLGKKKPIEDPPVILAEETPEFFNRIETQVKKELAKEGKAPVVKLMSVRKPVDDEQLTLARVRDKLDKQAKEIETLRDENLALRDELKEVKIRNKKLCQILSQGEMKEKAEVLLEVDRLETVRDELSEQVASLHAQLEQERSKVRALSNDFKSKDKNKKRTTSSGDQ